MAFTELITPGLSAALRQAASLEQPAPNRLGPLPEFSPLIRLIISACCCTALSAPLTARALETGGYLRGLAGSAVEDSGAACFKLPGAESKFRLGNECEIFGELMLSQPLSGDGEGTEISAHAMLSVYLPTHPELRQAPDEDDFGLPQLYLKAAPPALNGGSVWLGRRYYKREQVHITDFFYWNPSGTGFGIEDYPVGPLKLSYALMRNDNPSLNRHTRPPEDRALRHDLQLRGLESNPGGTLELGLSLIDARGGIDDPHDGWSITVQHLQSGVLQDGWNKLTVQYGAGPGIGLGTTAGIGNDDDVTRLRLIDHVYGRLSDTLSGMVSLVWQHDRQADGSRQDWRSLGARLSYDVQPHLKLNLELGHDSVKAEHQPERHLSKLTIAPTLALSPGFWSRPELRFFLTYAHWDDDARNAADRSADPAAAVIGRAAPFGDGNSAVTFGLQFETWW